MKTSDQLIIRWLGQKEYHAVWLAMQHFTNHRDDQTVDECWLLEHYPVFTQGQNGKSEHLLNPGNIPVVQSDRGGQITYHGPGQLMVYFLIDIKRKKLNVRELVTTLEDIVIALLNDLGISAHAKREAPGVYVDESKICSIGLRIRRGSSYHGIAFNVNMDLAPFYQINPCGFSGLKMTQLADYGKALTTLESGRQLMKYFIEKLGYTTVTFEDQSEQTDGK